MLGPDPNATALNEHPQEREQIFDSLLTAGEHHEWTGQAPEDHRHLEPHIRSIFTKLDLTEQPDANRRVAAVIHWLAAIQSMVHGRRQKQRVSVGLIWTSTCTT